LAGALVLRVGIGGAAWWAGAVNSCLTDERSPSARTVTRAARSSSGRARVGCLAARRQARQSGCGLRTWVLEADVSPASVQTRPEALRPDCLGRSHAWCREDRTPRLTLPSRLCPGWLPC